MTTIRVPDGDLTDGDIAGGNLADSAPPPLPQRLSQLHRWHYNGGKRDLRFDFLRGIAVVAMVTDHIGGAHSWLYAFTGGNRFFVSAAEAFVFISGLVFGIVEFSLMNRAGIDAALIKALKRVFTLYLFTTALTLTFAFFSRLLELLWAPQFNPGQRVDFIVGILTLHRAYYLTDVLLLYVLLVLAAGPALLLMEHSYTWAVLATSWGLWGLWQVSPAQAAFPWDIQDNSVFHFSAWQIFFITGLVIGFHRKGLQRRFSALSVWPVLTIPGVLFACSVVLYKTHVALLTRITPWHDETAVLAHLFEKDNVRVGRLIVFACFMTFAFALVTAAWVPLSRAFGWLFLPLGQHALGSYMAHLFVVGALTKIAPSWVGAEAARPGWETGCFQLAAILLIWGIIRLRPVVDRVQEALNARRAPATAREATTS